MANELHIGVKKTYKLTYEAANNQRAYFNKNSVRNNWSINAHVLRQFSEYFGARTENLDLFYDGTNMIFTSYTERIVHGTGKSVIRLGKFVLILSRGLEAAVTHVYKHRHHGV